MKLFRRLHYWWSLFVAAGLLLIFGPPVLFCAWLLRKHELVYPWALFGARNWLRLSCMNVQVSGAEHLDPNQTYVFISNHRSYLDTATLFAYTGRRLGLLAKRELLNVPILGYGMGFVNIMAIDRSNRERALRQWKPRLIEFALEDRLRYLPKAPGPGPASFFRSKKGRSTWPPRQVCRLCRSPLEIQTA